MDCAKVKRLLMEYIDGELGQNLKNEVAEHLKSCPGCKEIETSLLATVSPFKNAEKLDVPSAVWSNIKDSINAQGQTVLVPHFGGRVAEFFRDRKAALVPVAFALVFLMAVSVFSIMRLSRPGTYDILMEEADSYNQLFENGDEDFGVSTIFDNGLL